MTIQRLRPERTALPNDTEAAVHAQIVLEISGYVPPHAHYVFPPSA